MISIWPSVANSSIMNRIGGAVARIGAHPFEHRAGHLHDEPQPAVMALHAPDRQAQINRRRPRRRATSASAKIRPPRNLAATAGCQENRSAPPPSRRCCRARSAACRESGCRWRRECRRTGRPALAMARSSVCTAMRVLVEIILVERRALRRPLLGAARPSSKPRIGQGEQFAHGDEMALARRRA